MKKGLTAAAVFMLLSAGLQAQEDLASETGWLSFGLVSGGFVEYEGTELNAWDNSKWTASIGWAQTVLNPIPLYIGWELHGALAMVGESSSTATVYYELWGGYGYFTEAYFSERYWDLDLSPRVTALLRLGAITAQAYAGINANWLIVDWEYDDGITREADTEVVNGPEVQALFGVRAAFSVFYADYTRYFNIVNGKIDRSQIAANRVGLGFIFLF